MNLVRLPVPPLRPAGLLKMSSTCVLGRESPSTYRLVRLRLLALRGIDGGHFERHVWKMLKMFLSNLFKSTGRIIHDHSLAGQDL